MSETREDQRSGASGEPEERAPLELEWAYAAESIPTAVQALLGAGESAIPALSRYEGSAFAAFDVYLRVGEDVVQRLRDDVWVRGRVRSTEGGYVLAPVDTSEAGKRLVGAEPFGLLDLCLGCWVIEGD